MRGWLAAVLLVTGCAAPEPAMWLADARFTDAERAAIVEGEAWIAMQGGHEPRGVAFTYVPDGVQRTNTIERVVGPAGAAGQCSHQGGNGVVYIDPAQIRLETLPGLTAHEIAHCRYGFDDAYHAGDEPSEGIMRVLAPMRWTAAEEAQCERTRCRHVASPK